MVSIYKIFLLVTQKDVKWFAISYSIDYFLISSLLIFIYLKIDGNRLKFCFSTAVKLIKRSKYYILSAMMINLFMQTDRIMLKLMKGNEEAGFYIAAATCSGLLGFVFAAINDSMRPLIFEYKKNDNVKKYIRSLKVLFCITVWLSILYSVFITFFSPLIIKIMYGDKYLPSIVTLQILVWYSIFSNIGGAKDVWILAESKQKYLIYLNSIGALINIILNFIFINFLGAAGAALASLLTQLITNVLLMYLIPALRPCINILFRSINFTNLYPFIKKLQDKSIKI